MSGSELTGAAARRERSRIEMRQAILAEARRIVTEQGYDHLSMRAIARALGYSPGALYEYFRDKEAILHSLYFEGSEGLGGHMRQVMGALPPGADPVTVLATLGRGYRSFALDHAELYRLAFSLPKPPGAVVQDEDRGGFALLVQAVRDGIAAGVLAGMPEPMLGIACWAAVHGFVSLELSGHLTGGDLPGMPPATPEAGLQRRGAMFEHLLETIFYGLVREDHRAMTTSDPVRGPVPAVSRDD